MNIEKAIEILELHNKWRRDNDGKYEMAEPKELGIAIDKVVSEFKNLHLQNVSNSALIDIPLTYCPKCKSTDIRQYTKGIDKCNNCNHAFDIYRPFKGID